MRLQTVAMRKWMLISALPVSFSAFLHPIAPIFLASAWMVSGLCIPEQEQPMYQRRIGPLREGARAFFALSSSVCLFACFLMVGAVSGLFSSWQGMIWRLAAAFSMTLAMEALLSVKISVKNALIISAGAMVISGLLLCYLW